MCMHIGQVHAYTHTHPIHTLPAHRVVSMSIPVRVTYSVVLPTCTHVPGCAYAYARASVMDMAPPLRVLSLPHTLCIWCTTHVPCTCALHRIHSNGCVHTHIQCIHTHPLLHGGATSAVAACCVAVALSGTGGCTVLGVVVLTCTTCPVRVTLSSSSKRTQFSGVLSTLNSEEEIQRKITSHGNPFLSEGGYPPGGTLKAV